MIPPKKKIIKLDANTLVSPWCTCSTCYEAKCIKMETTTGTKVEDDGEDGCFIDYSNLGLEYDKHVELNIDEQSNKVRTFESGATRDQDLNKLDFEGFLSPLVLEEFAKYMHKNRIQSDGSMRSSENWQKGIPKDAYMKSAFRHFHDWWKEHRGYESREGMKDALMGLLFNVMGYTFEILKEEKENE